MTDDRDMDDAFLFQDERTGQSFTVLLTDMLHCLTTMQERYIVPRIEHFDPVTIQEDA